MSTRNRGAGIALLTLLITVVFGLVAGPAMAKSEQGDAHAKNSEAAQEETWDTSTTEDTDSNDATANCPTTAPDESRHPSGKDRYCESGGSGNQGNSQSHPDDTNGPMRAEGAAGEADKPGGDELQGGEYLWDQDGNNGCGNDQDFDDDNNGWCGKPEETTPEVESTSTEVKSTETVTPAVASAGDVANSQAAVLGVVFERPAEVAPAAAAPAQVAGVSLARTGGPFAPLAGLGVLLIGAGAFLRRFGRSAA